MRQDVVRVALTLYPEALGLGPQSRHGTSEGWELFTVEAVNPAAQTVIIYKTAYGPRLANLGAFNGNPPCYINLVGNNFLCNAAKATP